jgi:predicted RNA-binding protein with EMAP domain
MEEPKKRDTSWDEPQLSDGDFSPLKKQREELIKKWERSGLLDSLNQPNKTNIASLLDGAQSCMLNEDDLAEIEASKLLKKETPNLAELLESEASVLLKKEILNMDELNYYLIMLADMKNIGIRRKLVLLEGFINKVRREIEHQNGRYKNSSPEE